MRQILPAIAAASQLASCTPVWERPLALEQIGLSAGDVLSVEREVLAKLRSRGLRREMTEIDAVEELRCVTSRYGGADVTSCNYKLRYRKPDGSRAVKTRKNQTFGRDGEGRWEPTVVVLGS